MRRCDVPGRELQQRRRKKEEYIVVVVVFIVVVVVVVVFIVIGMYLREDKREDADVKRARCRMVSNRLFSKSISIFPLVISFTCTSDRGLPIPPPYEVNRVVTPEVVRGRARVATSAPSPSPVVPPATATDNVDPSGRWG